MASSAELNRARTSDAVREEALLRVIRVQWEPEAGSVGPKARHGQGCNTRGVAAQAGARCKRLSLKASTEKMLGSSCWGSFSWKAPRLAKASSISQPALSTQLNSQEQGACSSPDAGRSPLLYYTIANRKMHITNTVNRCAVAGRLRLNISLIFLWLAKRAWPRSVVGPSSAGEMFVPSASSHLYLLPSILRLRTSLFGLP